MKDLAVVGSGVGGSSIAALLNAKGYDVVLFEKEPYLGGCSSTFSHNGYSYNTGATTLSGYEDGFIVKEVFDEIGVTPELIKTDPTIVVIQNHKTTPRYKNFSQFLSVLQHNYPHPMNEEFWRLIYEINQNFFSIQGHYYANESILKKIKSLSSFLPLFLKFQKYFRVNSFDFTKEFLEGIDAEYLSFLEAQVYIVAQAPMKEINFLTAALSLAYTFNENHYVVGGFGTLFNEITKNIKDVKKSTEVEKIIRFSSHFELHTSNGVYKAKKVILNSTVYDSAKLFKQDNIKKYYQKYEKLNNYQSSFMLYMTIKSEKTFEHHYQLIQEEIIKDTISKAIFVSFSSVNDSAITKQGHYSITASIHTDSRLWENEDTYEKKKEELRNYLENIVMTTLGIQRKEVLQSFSATSKTFEHYIKRSQLGGNAISIKNFLPLLPGNDTKIKNLYNVGDTVYAAQGWPGVMIGVKNLKRLLGV